MLLASACGTADNRLDPGDLELRDVLGISPEVASTWDAGQRASARQVLDEGLARVDAPARAAVDNAVIEKRVTTALASIDGERARRQAGALGLVRAGLAGDELLATTRASTIQPHTTAEIRFVGWDAWKQLPARDDGVLASLAADAGHPGGPLVVTPAPRLAAVAAYVPGAPARLVVNPVVLAALEPAQAVARTQHTPPAPVAPTVNALANPYSFYGSVAECAAAQEARCVSCLPSSCTAITSLGDGNAECLQLAANSGRGYSLICIDLALAIDSVASCTANSAPSCSFDIHASESITTLDANAKFLDDGTCAAPLDNCLSSIFGSPNGTFGDAGTGQPRDTSANCGDACNDSNCDDDFDCELDGPDCEDSQACDGTCASSNDSGGNCGGEDACGSDNTSGCDNGDCGGGGGGGDCGGSGGDCSGGGGDCGGGGGDCSGGGGDCGGGDCNAGKPRARGTSSFSIVWALLPVPFAVMVRRRAQRRRAEEEYAKR